MRYRLALFLSVVGIPAMAVAGEFVCAGDPFADPDPTREGAAAKAVEVSTEGTRNAIVLFAKFRGELPGETAAPPWAQDIFDPEHPGSFSHFYDTMSFGRLRVRGEAAPRRYESDHQAHAYLSTDPGKRGRFGQFNLEILRLADADIDFSRFDNDGPDGIPNSGDDDGLVDVVFVVAASTPPYFLVRRATGAGWLGFEEDFVTDDVGADGGLTRIPPGHGTIQRGGTFAEVVGPTCHEYGHHLGLPDLYDVAFIREDGASPEEDSAGIGNWGLMGWGASGWHGDDGPNSLCAWSRMQLGWAQVTQASQPHEEMELPEVGREGDVYQIPVARGEFFLLEYRRSTSTHYDRHVPADGLLIWHVRGRKVDLECADGKWLDKGYPLGQQSDSREGEDNLDFWAHDEGYAGRHAGNLGDATDPFDGVRFRALTPETNPDSYDSHGWQSGRIEAIHLDGPVARAAVQLPPPQLGFLAEPWLFDASGDGILSAAEHSAESAEIRFFLRNTGLLTAAGVRAVLSSEDPLIEIQRPSVGFGDLEAGEPTEGPLTGEAFPLLRLVGRPEGERHIRLALDVYLGDTWHTRHEFTINAAPTFRLSGRVVDEAGRGIPGVEMSGRGFEGVLTGPDGHYEIFAYPGDYALWIEPGEESGPPGYLLRSRTVDVELSRDTALDITVKGVMVCTLSGRVVDEEGSGIPGAEVSAKGLWGEGETGADGSYRVDGPPGVYALRIGGPWDDIRRVLDVQLSDRITTLDIVIGPSFPVSIIGRDREGRPIDLRWFVIEAVEQVTGRWYGCAEGDCDWEESPFTMMLPRGTYRFAAAWGDGGRQQLWRDIRVEGAREVELPLKKGVALTVELVDEEGVGIRGEIVLWSPSGGWFWDLPTSRDGVLNLPWVAPDVYTLRYRAAAPAEPFVGTAVSSVPVFSDTTVRVVVRRGLAVSGVVHGVAPGIDGTSYLAFFPHGTSDPRAAQWWQRWQLWPLWREVSQAYSASISGDGSYQLGLPEGRFYVVAHSGVSLRGMGRVQLLGRILVEQDDIFDFTAAPGLAAPGRLLTPAGKLQVGMEVQAHSLEMGVAACAPTDPHGSFVLSLTPGSYEVVVSEHRARFWNLGRVAVPPTDSLALRLPSGASLIGQVVTAEGDPVEPALVVLARDLDTPINLDQRGFSFVAAVLTGAAGRYAIEVQAGTYQVAVFPQRHTGVGRVVRDVGLSGDRTQDLVLPAMATAHRLHGAIRGEPEIPRGAVTLQFYDRAAGVVAQTTSGAARTYSIYLPAGPYRVRAGVSGPVGGFERVYDAGPVQVDGPRRWDIELTSVVTATGTALDTRPTGFALQQNYPNPFNPSTGIRYRLPKPAAVDLSVYDLLGQKVVTLVDAVREAGTHVVRWDGRGEAGRELATGVYLYRLQAGTQVATRKLMLLR